RIIRSLHSFPTRRSSDLADLPAGTVDKVILVDDVSQDETVEVARRLGLTVVIHVQNRGYGGNQKTCYLEALKDGADIVVMLHPRSEEHTSELQSRSDLVC